MRRASVVAAVSLLASAGAASGRDGQVPARTASLLSGSPAAVRYAPPLPEPLAVVRRFDPPATPYGPGHLGVDLRAAARSPLRAAADGLVRFAGQVAGRGVVVLSHADGVSTEYEPVRALVHTGSRVRRGQAIGLVNGQHRGCAGSCLHWGAKRGRSYLDPLSLLRPLGPVVLLPWAGDP